MNDKKIYSTVPRFCSCGPFELVSRFFRSRIVYMSTARNVQYEVYELVLASWTWGWRRIFDQCIETVTT